MMLVLLSTLVLMLLRRSHVSIKILAPTAVVPIIRWIRVSNFMVYQNGGLKNMAILVVVPDFRQLVVVVLTKDGVVVGPLFLLLIELTMLKLPLEMSLRIFLV
ncbi:unnamed protein product [Arabis nemorensis]|uniref:Uncharacterized protein n=1 Tax=Arabis nemorensis TaxID=586526 RepID=A0A565CRY6_9BRAS|nr:unnamed protein product [Arabis nemorensis]